MAQDREIRTKVVGVTYANTDGTDRQGFIAKCKPGNSLGLIAEDDNPHDATAVSVWRRHNGWFSDTWQQLGYLNRDLAEDVHDHMNSGGDAYVRVLDVTGGARERPTLGLNIVVVLKGG